jgi:hypothetical protein
LCSDDGQPGSYQLVRRVSTDNQAIAVVLDGIPFRADPTFAAMLDIGIRTAATMHSEINVMFRLGLLCLRPQGISIFEILKPNLNQPQDD